MKQQATRHPAARFWNRIARKYAGRPVEDETAYRRKLDQTAALLLPDMRVLEYGCGTGTTALIHAPRVAHIDAIDFSSEMIAIAREMAKAQGIQNVDFHVAAVEDWKPPEGGYDMVMAHSILHLVDDLDTTLAHSRAYLRPGGYFVSSTVCIRDMGLLIAWLLPVAGKLRLVPKVRPLSGDELRQRITRAGFEEIEYWKPGKGKAAFIIAKAM